MSMGEYDFEPVRGLPGNLPPGEELLWQGSPAWQALARGAFRVVPVGVYFVLLAIWRGTAVMAADHDPTLALRAAGLLLLLGAVSVGVLGLLAWLNARVTVYSITSRRLVIRHGVALTMALNVPFSKIASVNLSTRPDGNGDVALTLIKGERLGYLLTWPHVRPWHYLQPQPTLRAIPDAAQAGAILARALAASGAASAAPVNAGAERAPAVGVPPSSATA
jgi:hypothetical protein